MNEAIPCKDCCRTAKIGIPMAKTKTSIAQKKKRVEALTHEKAKRLNIPTAEYQSVMRTEELSPGRVAYERRNRDLDPQLVWRGKDERDWSDLVVPAPPLYIQEKVHPKVLIDDLQRQTRARRQETGEEIPDSSPTSTASPRAWTALSFTSTTRTGRTE